MPDMPEPEGRAWSEEQDWSPGHGPGAGPAPSEQPAAASADVGGQAGTAGGLDEDDLAAIEAVVEELELSEAARQRDEYLDSLRRLQAEFDNYRKRVERQRRDMVDNAATALVTKLLPVLDTVDLALAHGAGEDVKQVAGALFEVLSKEGLHRVVPEGQPFDPQHHDAVAHEPAAEGQGPGVPEVTEVLRAGYEWKGRVLRPAMVKVRG